MSDYEKLVRHRLIDADMTQAELIEKVKEKTGGYFDRSYLSKIFKGRVKSTRFCGAINEILGIEASA